MMATAREGIKRDRQQSMAASRNKLALHYPLLAPRMTGQVGEFAVFFCERSCKAKPWLRDLP